jgi:hypothetical protein
MLSRCDGVLGSCAATADRDGVLAGTNDMPVQDGVEGTKLLADMLDEHDDDDDDDDDEHDAKRENGWLSGTTTSIGSAPDCSCCCWPHDTRCACARLATALPNKLCGLPGRSPDDGTSAVVLGCTDGVLGTVDSARSAWRCVDLDVLAPNVLAECGAAVEVAELWCVMGVA